MRPPIPVRSFSISPASLRSDSDTRLGSFLRFRSRTKAKRFRAAIRWRVSPDTESVHKVTIKRVDDGRISNWLNDKLSVGDSVRVLPPGGLFVLNRDTNPVVMFAGGSGITPVISILKTALSTTKRSVKLIYANRDEASIIFKTELGQLLSKFGERLQVVHCLDDTDGFLTASRVGEFVGGLVEAEYYVCGPGAFMDVVEQAVAAAGVAEARVHIERFVSPPDPDERPSVSQAQVAAASGEAPSTLTVYIDGKTQEIPYEAGQTVLAAAQKAGLEPPFSCTDGFCGCCMAKVTAGSVEMINNDFLSKKELEQGWVLTCQSVPKSGPIKVDYPD